MPRHHRPEVFFFPIPNPSPIALSDHAMLLEGVCVCYGEGGKGQGQGQWGTKKNVLVVFVLNEKRWAKRERGELPSPDIANEDQ